jgi:hypothetical protein
LALCNIFLKSIPRLLISFQLSLTISLHLPEAFVAGDGRVGLVVLIAVLNSIRLDGYAFIFTGPFDGVGSRRIGVVWRRSLGGRTVVSLAF